MKIIRLLLIFCFIASLSTSSTLAVVSIPNFLDAIRVARGDNIPTNPILMEIAQERAQEISVNFSHDGARAPWQWGEVLAVNNFEDSIAAEAAVQGFLNSPSHNAVLLGSWTHIGVGIFEVEEHNYFVALFANIPTANPTTAPIEPPIVPIPRISLPPTDTK